MFHAKVERKSKYFIHLMKIAQTEATQTLTHRSSSLTPSIASETKIRLVDVEDVGFVGNRNYRTPGLCGRMSTITTQYPLSYAGELCRVSHIRFPMREGPAESAVYPPPTSPAYADILTMLAS